MFKVDVDMDIYMERRMNRYLYFKLKSVKTRFNLDISMVLSYLELIEFEIRDIISMIESARYGMDYDEARKYLIKAI
jgi:V/A-type H+-transporting ATPase subunit C